MLGADPIPFATPPRISLETCRISLETCRLQRVVTVGMVCALPVSPTKGIAANVIDKTNELRLLLLQ